MSLYAIIDTETTGGSPATSRIIEIAIFLHNGSRVVNHFSTLINPGVEIPPFIKAFTGISNEMVANAPTFAEVAERIHSLVNGQVFVAHNVRFDYGIVANEFRRNGYSFYCKQLCTIRLARKVFEGLKSYSLTNICRHLMIDIHYRHRAFGDAEATVFLFESLLMNGRNELIQSTIDDETEMPSLPPKVNPQIVAALPETVGVYYFLNEKGKVIYTGKSKNIRKRILAHFNGDLHEKRYLDLKEKICDIDFKLTGNELHALVYESLDIKRFMPQFNQAQKRKKYRYGLFFTDVENGPTHIHVRLLNDQTEPFFQTTSRVNAEKTLKRFIEKFRLCPEACHFYGDNSIPEIPPQKSLLHDEGMNRLRKDRLFPAKSFVVLLSGRNLDEYGVIWVENFRFKGIGYIDHEIAIQSGDMLEVYLETPPYYPDTDTLILNWMRRNHNYRLISLE